MSVVTKTVNEALQLIWDFSRAIETIWRPGVQITSGDYRRPTVANGFEYQSGDTGMTGSREPDWPITVGDTVEDGAVTWTAAKAGVLGSDTIDSATVVGVGLTIGTPVKDDTTVRALISGGSGRHDLVCKITTTSLAEVVEDEVVLLVGV